MTLVEHLGELRTRLIISLAAIAVAFVVTYIFHGRILDWLNRPLPDNLKKPATFSPIEPFTTSIMVSLWAALIIALPIVFWQIWAFLAPAFTEHYQRSMSMLVAFAAVLGLGGLAFGYYVILPPAIHFLTNYDSSHFNILLRARDYYRFVSFVLLGVALAFEVPVFVLALVRLRILSRGAASPHLACGRLPDGRDRGAPPRRRPGDDDPLLHPARRPVRPLDRPRDVLRAPLAARTGSAGSGDRALTTGPGRAAGPTSPSRRR